MVNPGQIYCFPHHHKIQNPICDKNSKKNVCDITHMICIEKQRKTLEYRENTKNLKTSEDI